MKYKLLKDILEFKAGSIYQLENGYIHLGYMEHGWDIPEFILIRNPDYFLKLTEFDLESTRNTLL